VAERFLPRLERTFLLAAARADAADLLARFARGGFLPLERPAGVGDGGFGGAQRIARLAPVRLAAFEIAAQRLELGAQRGEVLFASCCVRGRRGEGEAEEPGPDQALAFPCAATAAMRLAISAWSPR
jgi:hypothetical protein